MLPMGVLYGLSGFLFLTLYKLGGYRKDVVMGNISRSFPEKSEQEHKAIASKFYRHFCDLIVESVKAFSISEAEIRRRVQAVDNPLLKEYFENGQNVLLVSGHFGNWELFASAAAFQTPYKLVGIYKKLKDPFFDQKARESRGKFGCELVSSKEVTKAFEGYIEPVAVAFLMDQAPVSSTRAWWMEFLNQDTAVLFGTERYAKKYDLPVLYGRITKVKRGHYLTTFDLVCDKPNELPKGEITERMTRMLEADIRKAPEYWLWTHKRWKRRRDDGT